MVLNIKWILFVIVLGAFIDWKFTLIAVGTGIYLLFVLWMFGRFEITRSVREEVHLKEADDCSGFAWREDNDAP